MFARALTVAVALTLIPAIPAAANDQLEQTRREIRATRARLGAVVSDDQAVLRVLNQVTARLNVEQSALNAARAALAKIDLQIRAEQRRLDELHARARARRAVVAARARALYIGGPLTDGPSMGSADSFDDYIMRASVIDYVASYDRSVLEDLARLEDETTKTKQALAVQREDAAAKRDDVAQRVEIVQELVSVQADAHQRLSSRASSLREEIAALEREQARIEALIRSRTSTGSVDTGGAGRLGFAWPIRGAITSPYGPRWGGFHTGMDIDCVTGDPIGASKGGKVIAAEWGGGYGNMIIIDHGGGYTTLYAHMSRFYVGRGATVGQHQRIGACGATGNATGDHLHFEVRINGNHTNPRPYLP